MKTVFLLCHLTAVLLAVLALWSMRHELTERAATRLEWALPPALAAAVAAILLIVSLLLWPSEAEVGEDKASAAD